MKTAEITLSSIQDAYTETELVPEIIRDIGERLVTAAGLMRDAGDVHGLCPLCGQLSWARSSLMRHMVADHQINAAYVGTGLEIVERWQAAADAASNPTEPLTAGAPIG